MINTTYAKKSFYNYMEHFQIDATTYLNQNVNMFNARTKSKTSWYTKFQYYKSSEHAAIRQ